MSGKKQEGGIDTQSILDNCMTSYYTKNKLYLLYPEYAFKPK